MNVMADDGPKKFEKLILILSLSIYLTEHYTNIVPMFFHYPFYSLMPKHSELIFVCQPGERLLKKELNEQGTELLEMPTLNANSILEDFLNEMKKRRWKLELEGVTSNTFIHEVFQFCSEFSS